jgi:hypothetical protein
VKTRIVIGLLAVLLLSVSTAGADTPDAQSLLWDAMFHHAGDQRAVYTIVDAVFVKHIAVALEEFAVDHSGKYPDALSDVEPLYLNSVPIVPGSPTGSHYGYEKAPTDRRLGSYVITDGDASVDASFLPGFQVPRGVNGPPCAPGECHHLEYAQKVGIIGLP